jgi:HEAT repeat protein
MAGNLVHALVKQLRKIVFSMSEKAPLALDDYEEEHFLIYHTFVGSTPENQRAFKDVRSDILHAVKVGSSVQLCMALRLPPLWWEDKLKSIFSQVDKKQALKVLLPELEDDRWPSASDPLGNEDWRVRSNAAYLLAMLDAKPAVSRMVRALDDTASNAKAAFCHIIYALGRMGSEEARQAVRSHLYSSEPWFRVDAAGALAMWPLAEVKVPLMEAMLVDFPLSDYMAVAITRTRAASDFLDDQTAVVEDGLCELIIGLIKATGETFNNEVALEARVHLCLEKLQELVKRRASPLHVQALFELCRWLKENQDAVAERYPEASLPATEQMESILDGLRKENIRQSVLERIKREPGPKSADSKEADAEFRHAIALAADLDIEAAAPLLLDLLNKDARHRDLLVMSLGRFQSSPQATKKLTDLAHSLVSVKERASRPLSKQPVHEDAPANAKTYWLILKALAKSPQAVDFLIDASSDFAPDKREQAILSLVAAHVLDGTKTRKEDILQVVSKALDDPSSSVKMAALAAVSQLKAAPLRDQVIRLGLLNEVSVSRQSFKTLSDLWDDGYAKEVAESVKARLESESDVYKKEKLSQFLQSRQG